MSTTTMHSPEIPSVEQEAGRHEPWIMSATGAVLNETQKGLWLLWRRRAVVLLEIITWAAFYPFIQFVIGNGTIDRALVPPTLLAFLTLPILYLAMLKLVGDLLEEVNSGTFEQMHLSPFSPTSLLVGRLLALVLEGMVSAVITGVVMVWALGVSIPLRLAGALPAALILMDIMGFALLIGGLTLSLPQIGSVAHLFSGLIMLLNGSLIPLEWYPGWVQTLGRFLPTTLGIEVARRVLLQGQSLASVWTDGTLPWLIVHAVGLFILGWLVFMLNDRRAMQRGVLR
jgi:ABC-type polysaccharide/polyol phosphate export permease